MPELHRTLVLMGASSGRSRPPRRASACWPPRALCTTSPSEEHQRAARRPGVVLTTGLSRVTWGPQHRVGSRTRAAAPQPPEENTSSRCATRVLADGALRLPRRGGELSGAHGRNG